MAPSALAQIDRVLHKTEALINAAGLTENAEDAYEKFWKRMETPFQRTAAEDSDAYRGFAFAYDDFREERDTMPAIMLDLKDVHYPNPRVIGTRYMAVAEKPGYWNSAYQWGFEQLHPSESERAEALARVGETDWHPPGLLDSLRDLEQALRKARSFCSDLEKRTRRPAIPMTAPDELLLATLADAWPAAVKQPDLERLTGISHQKISERLKWLETKRYVKRPEGTKRQGHAITPAGLVAVGRPVEGPH